MRRKEAIAPMLKEEIARAQKQGRTDLPATLAEARALLDEVRQRGASRVVDTLLPGIVGFCVPVFDSDGHMALGIVALGPAGTFDPEWGGAVDRPLRAAAASFQRPGPPRMNPRRPPVAADLAAGGLVLAAHLALLQAAGAWTPTRERWVQHFTTRTISVARPRAAEATPPAARPPARGAAAARRARAAPARRAPRAPAPGRTTASGARSPPEAAARHSRRRTATRHRRPPRPFVPTALGVPQPPSCATRSRCRPAASRRQGEAGWTGGTTASATTRLDLSPRRCASACSAAPVRSPRRGWRRCASRTSRAASRRPTSTATRQG